MSTFSWKIFFIKKHQKFFFGFGALIMEEVVKKPFTCPRDCFWENSCFEENLTLFFIWFGPKHFWCFGKKRFSRVIRTAFFVSRRIFRQKSFRKSYSVFHLFGCWSKELWLLAKTFRQSVKTASYVSATTLRRNLFLLTNSKSHKFLGFWQKFIESIVNTTFYVFSANLWATEYFLNKILVSSFFGLWAKKLRIVGEEKIGGVAGTACYMCEGSFWFEKKSMERMLLFIKFSEFELKKL